MQWLIDLGAWLASMGVLLCFSAFFSSSEAALFFLSRRDRRAFESGNSAQQIAAGLLNDPDRLMTAVLFWNLLINVVYFTMASIAALQLESQGQIYEATWFTIGSLLAIIFFGEMLPKSLAVLQTRLLAALVGIPMAASIRLLDPLFPFVRAVNNMSRRAICPKFKPEPYLEVADLERAVAMSMTDAALLRQEETVLQNIVLLSDLRVDELMRPRTEVMSFRPPVTLADLEGRIPRSGYVLVTEEDSDEVAAAIPLTQLPEIPDERLERYREEVVYVPWLATVATAFEKMRRRDRRVAVVVNEYGETIGVLTFDDVLDTIFSDSASRSARLMNRLPIRRMRAGVWHVTGMTSLRRLKRYFHLDRAVGKSVTVAGVMQEALQRVPEIGDECRWAEFRLKVIDAPQRGQLLIEMKRSAGARPTAEARG